MWSGGKETQRDTVAMIYTLELDYIISVYWSVRQRVFVCSFGETRSSLNASDGTMARSSIRLNIEQIAMHGLCNRRKYVTVVKFECEFAGCVFLLLDDLSGHILCVLSIVVLLLLLLILGLMTRGRSRLLLAFRFIYYFLTSSSSSSMSLFVHFRNMLFCCSSLIKLLQIILYIGSATLLSFIFQALVLWRVHGHFKIHGYFYTIPFSTNVAVFFPSSSSLP